MTGERVIFVQALAYIKQAVAKGHPNPDQLKALQQSEARLLASVANADNAQSRYGDAISRCREGLSLTDDPTAKAGLLIEMGSADMSLGRDDRAVQTFKAASNLAKTAHDRHDEALAMLDLGQECTKRDDLTDADLWLSRSYQIAARTTDVKLLSSIADALGVGDVEAKRYAAAETEFKGELEIDRQSNNPYGEAQVYHSLAEVEAAHQQDAASVGHYQNSLVEARIVGDRDDEAASLAGLMSLSAGQGNLRLATFYGKSSVNLYQSIRRNNQRLDQRDRASFLFTLNLGTYDILQHS